MPLAAYAETASQSYVVGYIVAGFLAIVISLWSVNSQIHTTAILAVISSMVFVLAYVIERQASLIAVQPILWQLILISGFRPSDNNGSIEIFMFLSISLALMCYYSCRAIEASVDYYGLIRKEASLVSLITLFITPAFWMFGVELNPIMPIGLFAAGMATYDYNKYKAQSNKEISVAIMVAGFAWLLLYLGVTNIQAYSHIIAATLAGFTWWRHSLEDTKVGDQYIYWALGTATIPLILQSLSVGAAGIYGWWLLLEQVCFMLIGIAIRKRFVINWGLYVAIGAVLYQLRDLQYVALAVLALFVIGIAMYQLQKYNKPDQ